jgi:hypothetical protein
LQVASMVVGIMVGLASYVNIRRRGKEERDERERENWRRW